MGIIVLKYSLACKSNKCAFRNERDEKHDSGPGIRGQRAGGSHGIVVAPSGLIYQSDEINELIGHIGQIEKNIGKNRAS